MSLLDDWGITADDIGQLINDNPSLRGMLLGYVAEHKLKHLMTSIPGVQFLEKPDDHNRKKKGDLIVIYKDRAFVIESKSLQKNMVKFDKETGRWSGKAQVDGSDRRDVTLPDGSILNTTLLLRGEFDILAVNCFEFGGTWRFCFARNRELPYSTSKKYTEMQQKALISSLVAIAWPPVAPFSDKLLPLLDDMVRANEGQDPESL